jgi:NOL1/NOP2/fmu family ribosome biogenesis protein
MYPLKFLNSGEKKKLVVQLNDQFGIEYLPENASLIRTAKGKIILFTGELTEKEMDKIREITFIEGAGVYIGKYLEPEARESDIRLTLEGTEIFKEQITKNIMEIEDKQMQEWMEGKDLPIETEKRGIYVIKYKSDLLGTGKASEKRIANFVPKERRLRERN